jgi:hypothetical protein
MIGREAEGAHRLSDKTAVANATAVVAAVARVYLPSVYVLRTPNEGLPSCQRFARRLRPVMRRFSCEAPSRRLLQIATGYLSSLASPTSGSSKGPHQGFRILDLTRRFA